MNLDEAKFKFEERFYLWSRENLKQEFSENFPILRNIKVVSAQHYLRILGQLDKHRAYAMAYALMRRGTRKEILEKWGDLFTEEDQEYVDLWLKMMDIEDHKDATQRSPLEYMQKRKFNRRVFRKYIKAALEPILGNDYEDWGSGNWRYCKSIGQWNVITWIDTGGQYHQLCYDHDIQVSNVLPLYNSVTLLTWYGIARAQTDWTELKDDDAESTAQSLAKVVKYFLDAAPKLLEGLTLDE